MKYTVVITDYMGDSPDFERSMFLNSGFEVALAPTPDPSAWIDVARKADAILTRHAPITKETIQKLEKCRIIARYGSGTDNVDVVAAKDNSIIVTNVPGYATSEVADHAWAMALALWRRLPSFLDGMRRGGWKPDVLPQIDRLGGSTLGLIGCGRIGSALAKRARAADMKVLGFDPYVSSMPDMEFVATPTEIAERSHIVSLHVPLTDETRHIVDERFISSVVRGVVLVNVARGGLLDIEAAAKALQSGQIGGLGLDVFENEPLPRNHPLRQLTNVLISPHVAYYSRTSVAEAKEESCKEILRVLAGEAPLHPVPST